MILDKKVIWRPEWLILLGKMPDVRVSQLTGIGEGAVVYQRMKRKIPAFERQRQRKWKQWEVALLGTMTDGDVAKKTKRDAYSVYSARALRGIPSWKGQNAARLVFIEGQET